VQQLVAGIEQDHPQFFLVQQTHVSHEEVGSVSGGTSCSAACSRMHVQARETVVSSIGVPEV